MGIMRRRVVAGAVAGAAVGRNRANRQNAAQQAPVEAPQAAAPVVDAADPIEEVKKLAALKDQGILTQDEFDQKKKELLGL